MHLFFFHLQLKCCGDGKPDKDTNIHRSCSKGDEKVSSMRYSILYRRGGPCKIYYVCYFVFQSCLDAIEEFFNGKLYIIGYVGIGIAGVMVRIHSAVSGASSFIRFSVLLPSPELLNGAFRSF